MRFEIEPIAHIENGFDSKFGIPRQSGILNEMVSYIVFEPKYRSPEALRGLGEFSHLWLIWQFSESVRDEFSPTVRPPRLGGNKRVGVFASRSPFRPNSLGLSSVKLIEIIKTADKGEILAVSGADLMNGTPIFDIKPYIKFSDSHPDALCSYADENQDYSLQVEIPEEFSAVLGEHYETVKKILAHDPRPSYQNDPERVYTLDYSSLSVSFKVQGERLTVTKVEAI